MANEKLSLVNGVDVSVDEDVISLSQLDFNNPVISDLIVIPKSEWNEFVKFVNKKMEQSSK